MLMVGKLTVDSMIYIMHKLNALSLGPNVQALLVVERERSTRSVRSQCLKQVPVTNSLTENQKMLVVDQEALFSITVNGKN